MQLLALMHQSGRLQRPHNGNRCHLEPTEKVGARKPCLDRVGIPTADADGCSAIIQLRDARGRHRCSHWRLSKAPALYSIVCHNTPENVLQRFCHLYHGCSIVFLFLGQVSCLLWDFVTFFAHSCLPMGDHVDSCMGRHLSGRRMASGHHNLPRDLCHFLLVVGRSHPEVALVVVEWC